MEITLSSVGNTQQPTEIEVYRLIKTKKRTKACIKEVIKSDTGVGNFSFSFNTEGGRTYTVETNANLGGGWGEIETVVGDGSLKTVSYPLSGTQNNFRVRSN